MPASLPRSLWNRTQRDYELTAWLDLISTHRKDRKFISGLSPTAKTRLPSFNKTQYRVVTGLLSGHNTLRRHLYIMGLIDSLWGRRSVAEEQNSDHVLCECEFLASLRHTYLVSLFLDPEDVKRLTLWAIWNCRKSNRVPMTWTSDSGSQRPCPKGLRASGPKGLEPIY